MPTRLDNLGETTTPDGRKLTLYHRHGDFYIDLDNEHFGIFMMRFQVDF